MTSPIPTYHASAARRGSTRRINWFPSSLMTSSAREDVSPSTESLVVGRSLIFTVFLVGVANQFQLWTFPSDATQCYINLERYRDVPKVFPLREFPAFPPVVPTMCECFYEICAFASTCIHTVEQHVLRKLHTLHGVVGVRRVPHLGGVRVY